MATRGTKAIDRTYKNFLMEESLRIAVQKQIESFIADDEMQMLQFPVSFTNTQRGFVHKYVQAKGLKSKSHGKGDNRCLTIYKPNTNTLISYDATLTMSTESSNTIKQFLLENKVTDREMTDAQELGKNKKPKQYYYGFAIFKLSVPPAISISYDIIDTHIKLPITNYREGIIDMINKNQVVVISGDTGSGKTTQVPQYILDDYSVRNEPCRIICTQPRRIAAVSMADRVAYERNEDVGHAVAYQIRLESKVSPISNLIYTTSGFLLRCLISDSSATWLNRVTHIIMDEVHERDKYTDFLFIAVKEAMVHNPKLKVILMSATIDTNIFTKYFDCPLVKIPGRMHPVDIYQLEDVLGMLGYFNEQVRNERSKQSDSMLMQKDQQSLSKPSPAHLSSTLDDDRNEMINETLQECYYNKSDFETLLKMGADTKIVGGLGLTASEWASKYGHTKCVELLQLAEKCDPMNIAKQQLSKDNQKRLQSYLEQTNETEIDHGLLFNTINFIHEQLPEGSILVFLPGYDAIVEQMNVIGEGKIAANIEVLFLHGNMETLDQKKVFARAPSGFRKIILSTNIAETSLTIDDVVYVIDCGKVKQISYDSLSESELTSTWISKACAKQRMGRAGRTRPGCCYRLYSKQRFDAMEEFTLPELLRIPLTELCLHARIMTKTNITDYLSKALQPPPISTINQSIKLLKTIGALNEKEDVTELGYRLVDLPVDVQLGKMLLYSILMKCLDPVLTIVSALSVKDPFVLNFENETPSSLSRKSLADNSCSDLMVFIKLYNLWMQHKVNGQDYRFCRENQISNGIMELINGFRSQILGQLRTIGLITPRGSGDMVDSNLNSNNFSVVKACFVAGFYPNVCRVDRKVGNLKSKQEKKLLPHVTSVLREKNLKSLKSILTTLPSEWLVYEEKSRVERLCLVRNNTVVTPLTIALFGGPMYIPKHNVIPLDDSDSENDDDDLNVKLVLDDWIYFLSDENVAVMIHELRVKLNALLMQTLCSFEKRPGCSSKEGKIIDVISYVLETEDTIAGFKCPKDVGRRPILSQVKASCRNKNKMQHSIGSVHVPNGKSLINNYQQSTNQQSSNQQSSYQNYQQQQWQPSAGPQWHKKTPPPRRSDSKSIYFRSEGKSATGASNSNMSEFDLYVSNFKKQVALKPKLRYFVLHTDKKETIIDSCQSSKKWQFSVKMLRHFKTIKKSTHDTYIILFFMIPNCTFFGMARVCETVNFLSVQIFTPKEVNFIEAREIESSDPNYSHGNKRLDEYSDGQEILNIHLAEKLFRLFLSKVYTGKSF